MKEKFNIGILTHNRLEYFTKVYNSIPKELLQSVVILNNGTPYEKFNYGESKLLQTKENLPLAKAKNELIRNILKHDVDYIFLMEDDLIIKNGEVFNQYIKLLETTKLLYSSFCAHSFFAGDEFKRTPSYSIEYPNGVIASLYSNTVNVFNIYKKEVFTKYNFYFDENYKSTCVYDVDMIYQISKSKLTTPFWNFLDMNSNIVDNYLELIEESKQNSQAHLDNWTDNVKKYFKYFKQKNGIYVNEIPQYSKEEVLKFLKSRYNS